MMSSINCCSCWPSLTRGFTSSKESRRYRSSGRAKYNEREYTIEFENLIEEEDFYTPKEHAVSEVEREFINKGKYGDLFHHQRDLMRKEEEILLEKEENARLEDEAYIQAKKEASRVARQAMKRGEKSKFPNLSNFDSVEFSKWLSEENIDITSPELDIEDFESFLEKVRSKSAHVDHKAKLFEQTLSQGLAATKIAGDALNALQPVELHAVDMSSDISPFDASPDVYGSAVNNVVITDESSEPKLSSSDLEHIESCTNDLKPVEFQAADISYISNESTFDPFSDNSNINKETKDLPSPKNSDDLICSTPGVQFMNQGNASTTLDTVVQMNVPQKKPETNLKPVNDMIVPVKDFKDDSMMAVENDNNGHSDSDSLNIIDDFDDDFVSSNVNAAFEDIL